MKTTFAIYSNRYINIKFHTHIYIGILYEFGRQYFHNIQLYGIHIWLTVCVYQIVKSIIYQFRYK